MPTKSNYEDLQWVLKDLKAQQSADEDNRDMAKECWLFINKKDGQWEPHWWDNSKDRPRYTFDQISSVVDQIVGDIERSDFDIKVSPAGSGAENDVAELYDGIVRNIERTSNATQIYNHASRRVVTMGIDGWRVV